MGEQLRAIPNHRAPGPATILRAKHRPGKLAEAGRIIRRGHQAAPGRTQHGRTPGPHSWDCDMLCMHSHTGPRQNTWMAHPQPLHLTCMHPHSHRPRTLVSHMCTQHPQNSRIPVMIHIQLWLTHTMEWGVLGGVRLPSGIRISLLGRPSSSSAAAAVS